ncbi:MAG: flagellar motor switch phosphatase FliY [Clostridium argentinense]|uniref:Flagellar motor switch phosphatase FliY n=1 Tax=Clostridium faecium TaxID=2762223 RepID=A0ABR8YNZ3_9CLOT|nr:MULTISPECIES: flagellar motor switch phosphatase FliY [Clostridium]MBD8045967.1 flagellar motor switch phosphatase FliY [Clostridium faecium]MBS5823922.1 flagellar motor switch phosphatase FliY [Clostridium argentinense]MDU1349517.1 flagellar motor switch phosphatase FliY [Clostridium argentinense]
MNNGFLSQEEIDSLLNGGDAPKESSEKEVFNDIEKDLLGEVGNISMGSAATALSTIIGKKVNITTPTIKVSTLNDIKKGFETPNVILDVKFTSGIAGGNLLIMKVNDASVIANLMMGGDGKVEGSLELSEIEISAVSEAMNQMIGSAATSMATMFRREVNISPPVSSVCDENTSPIAEDIHDEENVAFISFRMTIEDLIDSNIMQVLPLVTAQKIVSIMMGTDEEPTNTSQNENSSNDKVMNSSAGSSAQSHEPTMGESKDMGYNENNSSNYNVQYDHKPIETVKEPIQVKEATFTQLPENQNQIMPKNIDLILDVPLEVSVVLGSTKKNIRDILNLGTGSLIELDKLAEEPVDILVNGKKIAYGEVVVVDENFGVKITGIISGEERVRTLGK